jgi:soluble lytic murein transglycosylase-like protein
MMPRTAGVLHPVALAITFLITQAAPANATRSSSNATSQEVIKQIVREEAEALGVDAALALAVAHAESNFNPRAESRAGARGVMQLMPAVAEDLFDLPDHALWQPRTNIRAGLQFLKGLLDRYRGRIAFALSYYNGGTKVGPPSRARIIPATRPYVAKVLQLRQHYAGAFPVSLD